MDGLNNKDLFVIVQEPEKFEIKALADLASGENLLSGSWMALFSGKRDRELSGGSFIRALIPSWGLHPQDLITSKGSRYHHIGD